MSEEKTRVILTGQVVQCDFDVEEGFYEVMLIVEGEEAYIIEPDQEGGRLEEHLDRWVSVKGEVEEKDEMFFLSVHEFDLEDDGLSYEIDW